MDDQVSWGLTANNIKDGSLDARVPGSRNQNNDTRGTSGQVKPILFDQILVSADMLNRYTIDSIKVFDDPIAQEGHIPGLNLPNGTIDYASDHTPVILELSHGSEPLSGATPAATLPYESASPRMRIIQLLPNPVGPDPGHETVTLKNVGSQDVLLTGWKLIDRAGNEFDLSGTIKPGQSLTITLPAGSLPLNNSGGDEVTLFTDQDTQQDHVQYTGSEAKEGATISFGS